MTHYSENFGASTVSPAVRCAEKIVLLELISQLPGGDQPKVDPQSPSRKINDDSETRRMFSFEHESEIATTLAFLSGISDDHTHITAVCLEEVPAEGGCKVLLAINKLKPDCGQKTLDKVQRGFEQLFRRLSKISPTTPRKDRNIIKEAILDDIVALCRDRILRRLRVKASTASSYKKEGRFIGDNLNELLESPWQTRGARSDMTKSHLKKYRDQSRALLEHLYAFNAANDRRHEAIVRLVCHVAQFMAKVPLQKLIEGLKDHPMHASAKFRLHNCLSKIARYQESALLLVRRAKKSPILRNITVGQVSLDQAAFQRPLQTSGPRNLATVLAAIPHNEGLLRIKALPSWVQKSQHQFTTGVGKALRESKIHAEVQIVAFYEDASPEVVLPRVIASSKDACYLCHAVIKLHGKYRVPSSHGKLYKGWRLPAMQRLEALESDLHEFLEQGILTNVRRFAGAQQKPPLTLPNESTLFPLNISSSTLSNLSCLDLPSQIRLSEAASETGREASLTASKDDKNEEIHEGQQHRDLQHRPSRSGLHQVECSIDKVASSSSTTKSCVVGGNSEHDRKNDDEAEADQNNVTKTVRSESRNETGAVSDSDTHSVSSITTQSQQNDPTLLKSMVFRNGRFCHKNMEIFFEDCSLGTTLRWLSPADSAKVLNNKAVLVVDVLLLAAGTDNTFLPKDPEGVCYFSFGEQVVMIGASES